MAREINFQESTNKENESTGQKMCMQERIFMGILVGGVLFVAGLLLDFYISTVRPVCG